MPKLKENPLNKIENQQKQAAKILKSKIAEKCTLYDFDYKNASIFIRRSPATFYNRLNNPGDFTLNEIIRLGAELKFEPVDYMEILNLKDK